MSMQAINYALTLPVDEPGPRLLLILIAHHINWKTGDMFVSQEELADEAKMTSRTVRSHLGTLEERGFITRVQQRDTSGRRGVDRIMLVGYLEWQDVLYNGGTIPPPSSRGKPPENSSGRVDANRKNDDDQPEKTSSPTGSSFPVYKEPSLTLREPLARADARATQDAARPPRAMPRITVTPADASWGAWLDRIEADRGADARRAVEEARRVEVAARWPRGDIPSPAVTMVRDPTGGNQ